ncbi:HAD-like protein [Sistotremastrum suecicum HHB10207 ss-3]|uniref:HAD-like protein n=1 Tax=Sistotremastrum suecicum HHB10207 ss-3 TaxID=1314776 RepID=A0A166IYQ5_9AGAM|nr:HAD-like protein [Sistotremastrum suecicum HHB10207 ss-3]
MPIRVVFFDALHTIITPRLPIYVQYSQVFAPYLGELSPDAIRVAFKTSLKQIQKEKPAYVIEGGANAWWMEVIKRTALGAGADEKDLLKALPEIVPKLMTRFSSKEGYKTFPEVLKTLERLREMGIKIGVVSNADSRIRSVLDDLNVAPLLDTILLSEEEGIEKPNKEIWVRALSRVGCSSAEAMHVGDDIFDDYQGSLNANLSPILIRRIGAEGEGESKEDGENLEGVTVIQTLLEIPDRITNTP